MTIVVLAALLFCAVYYSKYKKIKESKHVENRFFAKICLMSAQILKQEVDKAIDRNELSIGDRKDAIKVKNSVIKLQSLVTTSLLKQGYKGLYMCKNPECNNAIDADQNTCNICDTVHEEKEMGTLK